MPEDIDNTHLLELTSDVVVAWLSNPRTKIAPEALPSAIQTVHQSLASLGTDVGAAADAGPEYLPAVTVRRSLASNEHIVSLIDGKPYKTLKRHLSGHGLTPQQYRERYNLKADYPMVAPAYAARRSELAKTIGLGRKPAAAVQKRAAGAKPKHSASKPSQRSSSASAAPQSAAGDTPATKSAASSRGKLTMFKSEAES